MHKNAARNATIGKIACTWVALSLAITAGLITSNSRAAKPDAAKQADAPQKVPGKITFVGKNSVAT